MSSVIFRYLIAIAVCILLTSGAQSYFLQDRSRRTNSLRFSSLLQSCLIVLHIGHNSQHVFGNARDYVSAGQKSLESCGMNIVRHRRKKRLGLIHSAN